MPARRAPGTPQTLAVARRRALSRHGAPSPGALQRIIAWKQQRPARRDRPASGRERASAVHDEGGGGSAFVSAVTPLRPADGHGPPGNSRVGAVEGEKAPRGTRLPSSSTVPSGLSKRQATARWRQRPASTASRTSGAEALHGAPPSPRIIRGHDERAVAALGRAGPGSRRSSPPFAGRTPIAFVTRRSSKPTKTRPGFACSAPCASHSADAASRTTVAAVDHVRRWQERYACRAASRARKRPGGRLVRPARTSIATVSAGPPAARASAARWRAPAASPITPTPSAAKSFLKRPRPPCRRPTGPSRAPPRGVVREPPRQDLRGLVEDLVGDRVVRLAGAAVARGRRGEKREQQAQVRRASGRRAAASARRAWCRAYRVELCRALLPRSACRRARPRRGRARGPARKSRTVYGDERGTAAASRTSTAAVTDLRRRPHLRGAGGASREDLAARPGSPGLSRRSPSAPRPLSDASRDLPAQIGLQVRAMRPGTGGLVRGERTAADQHLADGQAGPPRPKSDGAASAVTPRAPPVTITASPARSGSRLRRGTALLRRARRCALSPASPNAVSTGPSKPILARQQARAAASSGKGPDRRRIARQAVPGPFSRAAVFEHARHAAEQPDPARGQSKPKRGPVDAASPTATSPPPRARRERAARGRWIVQ